MQDREILSKYFNSDKPTIITQDMLLRDKEMRRQELKDYILDLLGVISLFGLFFITVFAYYIITGEYLEF